ncbi:TIGR01212 family radical SAM protein [Desulfomarina sp.]
MSTDRPRLHTFSYSCRQRFGRPVGKIAIDLEYPCPNREKGGCIFCSAPAFTPGYQRKNENPAKQIARGRKNLLRLGIKNYFGYFQQETPTAAPTDYFLSTCSLVLQDPDCLGLIISTRPDAVEEELLPPLSRILEKKRKEKNCLFELGIQSAHEKTLQLLNRNHGFADFQNSAELLQRHGFETGAHLIFGLPGETIQDMRVTVQKVCDTKISALKIHHLQVLKNTVLQEMYREGKINVFATPEDYFQLLLQLLPHIPPDITIHRLFATSHPEMLVAPKWNILTHILSRKLLELMEENLVCQGTKVQPVSV